MNKWTKVGISVGMGAAAVTATHVINKLIFSSAVADMVTNINKKETYKWKFGNISYTISGEGSPLLLIHDLRSTSSSYEWKNVIKAFSKYHTVYAIDLLGCGYSDKPNITYTTYMYTQLINDFVIHVINKKTDVIATGDAAPLTIMAAYNNPLIFSKIMLINPQSIKKAMINPGKKTNFRRYLLNSPIIGTLIYNICMSRNRIHKYFTGSLFYNTKSVSPELINAYSENAHLYGSSAKFLYTSAVCHYTTANIARAVKELNNCIYIIYGRDEKNINSVLKEYTELNPAIELASIQDTRHLPHLENPQKFFKTARIFI